MKLPQQCRPHSILMGTPMQCYKLSTQFCFAEPTYSSILPEVLLGFRSQFCLIESHKGSSRQSVVSCGSSPTDSCPRSLKTILATHRCLLLEMHSARFKHTLKFPLLWNQSSCFMGWRATQTILGGKDGQWRPGAGHPHCCWMSGHSWGPGALAGGSGGVSVVMGVSLQFALFTEV